MRETVDPEITGQRSEVSGRRLETGQSKNGAQGTAKLARLSTLNKCQSGSDQLSTDLHVALFTGGNDRPYVLGLTEAFTAQGIMFDLVGSDELSLPELLNNSKINFLNLRGDQRTDASLSRKAVRLLTYYTRLVRYAITAKPPTFHILWHNKFELFDRTLLILYYKLLGRKVVFTAHNVNAGKRDRTDSMLNRLSLRIQYRLVDHVFVHTEKMKAELLSDFRISEMKVTVIPFGLNNTSPNTELTPDQARQRLGISPEEKTLLTFGQIAPYKGLEYLLRAFAEVLKRDASYRLIIAGRPKWNEAYWKQMTQLIKDLGIENRIIQRIEHVPDTETELYFKAADVLVLPYVDVFQSGVLFLGYSFGLPAIASDVGSLKEDVIDGETGFVVKPKDAADLAAKIEGYFESDLFRNLETRRSEIKRHANEKYSWSTVAEITKSIYSRLLVSA